MLLRSERGGQAGEGVLSVLDGELREDMEVGEGGSGGWVAY